MNRIERILFDVFGEDFIRQFDVAILPPFDVTVSAPLDESMGDSEEDIIEEIKAVSELL